MKQARCTQTAAVNKVPGSRSDCFARKQRKQSDEYGEHETPTVAEGRTGAESHRHLISH